MTDTRKYGLNIWLRQPARKIRMASADMESIESIVAVLKASTAEVHGPTKAGHFVAIPVSNIAYVEVLNFGEEETDAPTD